MNPTVMVSSHSPSALRIRIRSERGIFNDFFGRIRMRATHAYIFLKATEKVDYSFMIKHVKSDLDRHN